MIPSCYSCARIGFNERYQLRWCKPEDKPCAETELLREQQGFICRMGWQARQGEPVHAKLAEGQRFLHVD